MASRKRSNLKALRQIYTAAELRAMGVTRARKKSRKHGGGGSRTTRTTRSTRGGSGCTIRGCIALAKRNMKREEERKQRKSAKAVKRVESKPHLLQTTGGSYGGGGSSWGFTGRDAGGRRKKKRGGGKRGRRGSYHSRSMRGMGFRRDASYRDGGGRYDARDHRHGGGSGRYGDERDWPGQPIRHKRASVLGWQRRLRGRRPKNPTFFGHRPVRSSARRDERRDRYDHNGRGSSRGSSRARYDSYDMRDADMRDWPGQPIRHKRAAALGWQRRLRGRKPRNPTFFGRRPVQSPFHPRRRRKKKRGRRDAERRYMRDFARDTSYRDL